MNTKNESLYDTNSPSINVDEFLVMVAENAYYRAEARGFGRGSNEGYTLAEASMAQTFVS
jgi:hypothetical protein